MLVQLAMQKGCDEIYKTQPANFILQYSNNPYEISEEVPAKPPWFSDSMKRGFVA